MDIILFVIIAMFVATEIAGRLAIGRLLFDSKYLPLLKTQLKKGTRLNYYSDSLMYCGDLPYITITPVNLLSKYYISNHGRIFRWSKMTKLINAEFKNLKKKN